MFIAIVGTRSSGKTTIEDYFIRGKGFTQVRLINAESVLEEEKLGVSRPLSKHKYQNFANHWDVNAG